MIFTALPSTALEDGGCKTTADGWRAGTALDIGYADVIAGLIPRSAFERSPGTDSRGKGATPGVLQGRAPYGPMLVKTETFREL